MRTTLITLTTLLALGTAACTTTPTTPPKVTVTDSSSEAADPAAQEPNTDGGTGEEPPGDTEFTQATFDYAWDAYTEEQRDIMCSALELLGPAGAAESFANDVPDQGHIDWPHFTQLVQNACTARAAS